MKCTRISPPPDDLAYLSMTFTATPNDLTNARKAIDCRLLIPCRPTSTWLSSLRRGRARRTLRPIRSELRGTHCAAVESQPVGGPDVRIARTSATTWPIRSSTGTIRAFKRNKETILPGGADYLGTLTAQAAAAICIGERWLSQIASIVLDKGQAQTELGAQNLQRDCAPCCRVMPGDVRLVFLSPGFYYDRTRRCAHRFAHPAVPSMPVLSLVPWTYEV